jgi:hypothetical protein
MAGGPDREVNGSREERKGAAGPRRFRQRNSSEKSASNEKLKVLKN